jgi:glucokinase
MIFTGDDENTTYIGVNMSGRYIQVGRVKGEVIEQQISRKINNREVEEVILRELISTIEEAMTPDVSSIGIGVPSVVDVKQGIVYKVINIPSWRKVQLKAILEQQFGVPVYVNNNANCFAIGEKYFGKGFPYDNMVGLIIGTGLGAGIVLNGHLYSGNNCVAGEFGLIPYKEHDYEYYCSEGYFEEKYGIKADAFLERAEDGDKIALAVFEQFGYDVGNIIKTIMYAVDPDLIVIGGALSKAFPYFEKTMWEQVRTFFYREAADKLNITQTETQDIAILGAAALCLDAKNRNIFSK